MLVNNAGIAGVGDIESVTFEDDLRDTLRASVFGMIQVTQRVLRFSGNRDRARSSTCHP
ncbi:hypothetical protein [Mycobacterium hodleri]|uniref:hypothetical protein n=1 Tax=Mycolicibacterium hodleri TaxID=49897 RepID=UPI00137560A8